VIAIAVGSIAHGQQPSNPIDPINFAVLTPEENPLEYEAARLIADMWRELGLEVTLTARPFHVHNVTTREEPWPFDVVFFSWGNRVERLDPNSFLFLPFHSSQAVSGGENRIGLHNAEYDAIVDQQARTMDFDERQELVFEAQEILADEAVMNVFWYQDVVVAYNHTRFANFVEMPGENINNEWSPMQVEPLTDDGVLRIGETEEPDIINPFAMTTTSEVRFARNFYDRLARIGPDGQPRPHMAESWTVISDTVVDIELRPDMKWHDGEDVTAEDVQFTFDYLKEWPVPIFMPFVDPIESVTVTGPLSVRMELKEPFAPFFASTLAQLFIVPKHIWQDIPASVGIDHPDQWTDPSAAIGSGPFRLVHHRRGEEALLERHDGYFMEPNIDGMLFVFYAQADAVVGALELGVIDVHYAPVQPVQLDRLEQQPHLTLVDVPSIGFSYFAFNTRNEPFDDRALRQALMHAVDYDLLIQTLLQGRGVPGGPGKVFTPANTAYNNPDVVAPPFDLDRARELLLESGYEWDSAGRLHYPGN
jgi:peptide/nickel transport system substrate-binding protein